jgi:tetratricopeptide (TPR) repeat protein
MSIDYALWKWKKEPPGITPGLCYLLLIEGVNCPEAAPLDSDRVHDEIEVAFPEQPFELNLSSSGIMFSVSSSTPMEVVEWFIAFAEREGMVFFDPQDERSITKADEKEFERRFEAFQAEQEDARAKEGMQELLAQAEAGDPKALFTLGNRYSFGEGVKKDLKMAFTLFEKSALAGCSDGMFNLAACYRFGEGVKKDVQQAISWYERAAESDARFSYFALGEIYANGETGTVDRDKAIHYLQLAWDHDNRAAYKLLRALGAPPI